jgi:transposase-like protein
MKRNQIERREEWRRRVKEQEESGVSVRVYCKQHGLAEHALYAWRRRVRVDEPISFALVKTQLSKEELPALELLLSGGERLRIPCEEAALGVVLRVLRAEQ